MFFITIFVSDSSVKKVPLFKLYLQKVGNVQNYIYKTKKIQQYI